MEKNEVPRPPQEGIVYGEIAYWILLIGMIVAIIGSVIYMASPGYIDKACLLNHLWQGEDIHTIWRECVGVSVAPQGHWYLSVLPQPDALAMIGISISCLAAVFGIWGAVLQMVRSRGGLYLILAMLVGVILTLSALGILSLEH